MRYIREGTVFADVYYNTLHPHPIFRQTVYYVAAKATYIRLLYGQKGGFSALAP